MGEPEEHNDFMSRSDCSVYKYEVKTENYDFGRVEYIDTNKASDCVKEQLSNAYLLYYYDTIKVEVYNEHPKDNIKLIEKYIKQFQTDTTRLANFVKFENSIELRVSRLCKDRTSVWFGKYVKWRILKYSITTEPYVRTKNELNTTYYKWTE